MWYLWWDNLGGGSSKTIRFVFWILGVVFLIIPYTLLLLDSLIRLQEFISDHGLF
jgi:hypothetical protein